MKLPALAFTLLLALDQATKIWVRGHVPTGALTPLVPGVFDLTYAPNPGVAFSTFADLPAPVRVPLLLIVPICVSVGLAVYSWRTWEKQSRAARVALVLILAGAVGNLVDRAFFGEVTDFVRFRWGDRTLFVNNLADDFISIGAAILAWVLLFTRRAEAVAPAPSSD